MTGRPKAGIGRSSDAENDCSRLVADVQNAGLQSPLAEQKAERNLLFATGGGDPGDGSATVALERGNSPAPKTTKTPSAPILTAEVLKKLTATATDAPARR